VLPDGAVRLGARRLRHRGSADHGDHPADLHPDRHITQRQSDRPPGERGEGPVSRHGRHHRDPDGLLHPVPAKGGEMATLTSAAGQAVSSDNSKKRRRPRGHSSVWRWVVMIIAGVDFVVPLSPALRFAGLSGIKDVFTTPGFGSSLWLSIRLAAVTWIVSMLLMIPTTVYVHLRMPGLRRLLEGVTILPIVIPPVVLIIGVLQVMPLALRASVWLLALEYVVLAMPFAYRALDAGLRAIDVKTLTEAAGSLGAGWLSTMWRVILPKIRTPGVPAALPHVGRGVCACPT